MVKIAVFDSTVVFFLKWTTRHTKNNFAQILTDFHNNVMYKAGQCWQFKNEDYPSKIEKKKNTVAVSRIIIDLTEGS